MFIMRKKRLLFFFLLFIGYFVGYDTVVSAQNVPVEGDKYILLTADKSFKEQIEGINAARILYLYPTTTNAKLIQKIIDSKVFVNYFDMPIQHINDEMLKIMRR